MLWRTWAVLLVLLHSPVGGQYNFTPEVLGQEQSIAIAIDAVVAATGAVTINGTDTRRSTTPFTWDWGDGSHTLGFFPQTHVYSDRSRNYIVSVKAAHGGITRIPVRFVTPHVHRVDIPADLRVRLPYVTSTLTTRLYRVPGQLTAIDDADLTIPRSIVEYVLSVAAVIQSGLTNGNYVRPDESFQQHAYRLGSSRQHPGSSSNGWKRTGMVIAQPSVA
jgi:hypothetical protein